MDISYRASSKVCLTDVCATRIKTQERLAKKISSKLIDLIFKMGKNIDSYVITYDDLLVTDLCGFTIVQNKDRPLNDKHGDQENQVDAILSKSL